jgi:hypothetical protein
VIDTAYVRLRPTAQGFQQEAEAGIKSGLRNVGSIVGGAFAAAGVFEAGKHLIEAAAEHQSAFAIVDQTLKNAHQSTDLYGVSVESLLEKEARLKGFHDEDLASSFVRLVSATGSSTQAFKDLGLAEDVARARHIDVAVAALALSRAEQGSTQSLSRLGVVIPKVNLAQAELKQRHDEAVASGAKFNAQQKLIYQDALAQAAASDKVSNRLHALSVVQDRFGGSATKFADTASGQFARTEQDIHQFEVAVGRDALPAINSLAEGVGHYAVELTNSASVQSAVKAGMHDIGVIGHDLKDVIETVGPTILTVATGAEHLAAAIGAPAIVTAVGTYKGLAIATAAAATAQGFYARAVAAGQPAVVAATGENAALAASEVAVGAAGEAQAVGGLAAFARGAGTLGLAAAGGPVGLAVLGVAGLAATMVYLGTRESDTQIATDNLRGALGLLGQELNKTKQLEEELAQSRISVSLAKDAKAAADAAVQQAQATELATRGTAEHAAAVLQLRTARDQDRQSALSVTQAEQQQTAASAAEIAHRKTLAADRAAEVQTTLALFAAEEKRNQSLLRGQFGIAGTRPTSTPVVARRTADLDAQAAVQVAKTLSDEAQKLQDKNPGLATSVRLLGQFTAAVGRLPTKAETKFILDPTNAKRGLTGIINDLRAQVIDAQSVASKGGHTIGKALADGIPEGVKAASPATFSAVHSLVKGAIDSGKTAAEARSPSAATAREIGLPLAQGIAVGINTGAPDIQRALTDTVGDAIRQGGQQVADSINQAKQNLNSIGSSLASTVGQFIDAGPLGAQIKALQQGLTNRQNVAQRTQLEQSVAAARKALTDAEAAVGPRSSQTPSEHRALTAFLAPQRQTLDQAEAALADFKTTQRITGLQARADSLKTSTATGIANLTDEFNKGAITAHRLNVGIAAILAKDDIDYRKAGKVLGIAFADGLGSELTGLRDQVNAIVGGPKLPGAGLAPTIVRPLETLHDAVKQIASAQAQRDANALAESKKHTKALDVIAAAAKAAEFTKSITPPGRQTAPASTRRR